ncbi:MAG: hypothetical protein ACD_21C00136G0002 [uncultured bacterium]|nr:MAG: hypothetical protein ACD_21C00136G0002 [uncultured bacterium]
MSKPILRSLFLSILIAPVAFADEPLSAFNQQGDIDHPKPNTEESYFATRAPMGSEWRGYAGLSVGMGMGSLKPKITKGTNASENISNSPMSYIVGAYGGCGTNFDHFYIGAELSGGYNSLNTKKTTTTTSTEIAITQPIMTGFDIMPGYLTQQKDLLFYTRLGVGSSLFKFKINNSSTSSDRKISFGWRAGLGMEYFMSDTFGLRVEYVWNSYSDIKKNCTIDGTSYSYELSKPRTQQVNFGLTINF